MKFLDGSRWSHFVHISDTHFGGRLLGQALSPESACQNIVDALMPLRRDFSGILISGDLSDNGSVSTYKQLKSMLVPLDLPIYPVCGNHDLPQVISEIFEIPLGGHGALQYFADLGPCRMIFLDTHVPERSHGELGTHRLEWLQSSLSSIAKPVILMMHHPPVSNGHWFMDSLGLRTPEFLQTITPYSMSILAILCGHTHSATFQTIAGIPIISCPSSFYAAAPQYSGSSELLGSQSSSSFMIHSITADRVISRVTSAEEFLLARSIVPEWHSLIADMNARDLLQLPAD